MAGEKQRSPEKRPEHLYGFEDKEDIVKQETVAGLMRYHLLSLLVNFRPVFAGLVRPWKGVHHLEAGDDDEYWS